MRKIVSSDLVAKWCLIDVVAVVVAVVVVVVVIVVVAVAVVVAAVAVVDWLLFGQS